MSIRSQIVDRLTADASLLALLPNGSQSIINESEYTESTPTPCLVINFSGHHPHQMVPELDEELWEVRVFDRGQAYFNIEKILIQVRRVLHRAILLVNDDGISAGLEMRYLFREKSRFDPVFRKESEGVVFAVPVLYST